MLETPITFGGDAFPGVDDGARAEMAIGAGRDAMFGGTFIFDWERRGGNVIWKLLTRMVPLFVAVSSIEDVANLDDYFAATPEPLPSEPDQSAKRAGKAGEAGKTGNAGNASEMNDAGSPPTRSESTFTRLRRILIRPKDHPGLSKWVVLPVMAVVVTLVLGMTGRLIALGEQCQYMSESSSIGSHYDVWYQHQANHVQPRRPHWVSRWCVFQAFPLLTTLPGSPSACACAVLYVRPATNETECDSLALSQLHDDVVNEDRQIAKYLTVLVHNCPMQNMTQMENILGTEMGSVTSIVLNQPGGDTKAVGLGLTQTVRLSDLRMKNLLKLETSGVPLTILSPKVFEKCENLINLELFNAGLLESPNIDKNPLLLELELSNNQITKSPNFEWNTKLVEIRVRGQQREEKEREKEGDHTQHSALRGVVVCGVF